MSSRRSRDTSRPPVSGSSRSGGSSARSSSRLRTSDYASAGPSSSMNLPSRSRRSSVSAGSGSGGERMMFSLSGSSDGSDRGRSGRASDRPPTSSSSGASSSSGSWEPTRRPGGAAPSSRFFAGGDTSSSESSSRSSGRRVASSAGDSRASSSLFGGSGSGSGSGAIDIPGRTGDLNRRPLVRDPARYPESGYTDQYKSGGWDSWKSDAPLRQEHDRYKSVDNRASSADRRYNERLDMTPSASSSQGLGGSHNSIRTNLTGSQNLRYGDEALGVSRLKGEAADLRHAHNQDHGKNYFKKGLTTQYDTQWGHEERVRRLDEDSSKWAGRADDHYSRASRLGRDAPNLGVGRSEYDSRLASRETRRPVTPPGPERTVGSYENRLRRTGRLNDDDLTYRRR